DRQLAALFKELSEDPKTREPLLRLIKHKRPNESIPEIDTRDAMQKFAQPHIDKVAALEKKLLEKDVSEKIDSRRQGLRDQGFGADDVKAIEAMMVKEGIANHATAANYYRMQKQLAPATPSIPSMVNKLPVDGKALKAAGGAKAWARNEAANAIADIKAGRV